MSWFGKFIVKYADWCVRHKGVIILSYIIISALFLVIVNGSFYEFIMWFKGK